MTINAENGNESKDNSKLLSIVAGEEQTQGVLLDINAKDLTHGTALKIYSNNSNFTGRLVNIISAAKNPITVSCPSKVMKQLLVT